MENEDTWNELMNKILMYTVRTCYIAGSLGIEKNICGYFVFDHNSKIDEWIRGLTTSYNP